MSRPIERMMAINSSSAQVPGRKDQARDVNKVTTLNKAKFNEAPRGFMDGYRFNRKDVQGNLTIFRNNLRAGKVMLDWSIPNNLRIEIASVFGIKPQDFNTEYFCRRTLDRFAIFFAIPRGPNLDWRNPSLDEVATAVQHFINRRREPWADFRVKMMAQEAVNTPPEYNDPDSVQDPSSETW